MNNYIRLSNLTFNSCAACKSPKIWDFDLCNCVCPVKLNCFNWNEATCSCGSLGIDNGPW